LLFRSTHANDTLRRALRAAIAAHRPLVVQHLAASHGAAAIAAALSAGSARVIADALSMLPHADRVGVSRRLPRHLSTTK
jgi:hypothetical protein